MRAFDAELRKLATLPAMQLTLLVTAAATALLAYASGRANAAFGLRVSQVAGWAMIYVQAGFVALGALAGSSEYQGGQHRISLLAVPRRIQQAVAKLAAFAAFAVAMAVMVQGISLLGYWLGMGRPAIGDATELARNLAGSGLVGVLLAIFAWGIALVTRSAMAAMAPLLGLCLFVAPLLMRYTTWAKYLPGNAGFTLIIYQPGAGIGPGLPGLLDPLPGGLVLAGWAFLAGAAAVVSFLWRDA